MELYLNQLIDSIKSKLDMVINEMKLEKSPVKFIDKHIEYLNIVEKVKGPFTPSIIINIILNKFKYYQKLIFKYKLIIIEFNILNDSLDIDIQSVIQMAIKVNILIESCIRNNQINKFIKIYYIPIKKKKKIKFDNSKCFFSSKHINSGFTNRSNNDTYSVIFREEEHDKVLLHEMIHYLDLEFSNIYADDIHLNILQNYDLVSDIKYINLFEAYTDFMAILYNSIINGIIQKKSIKKILQNEQKYQNHLNSKILDYFGMSHIVTSLNTKKGKLKQTTNVISYFFFKSILMDNYPKILKLYPLGVSWNRKIIEQLYNLINDKIKQKIYVTPAKNIYKKKNLYLRMTYL